MNQRKSISIASILIIVIIGLIILIMNSFANNKPTEAIQEERIETTISSVPDTEENAAEEKNTNKNSNHTKKLLELPLTNKKDLIISHTGYTLSFDKNTNNPKWVAWELTKDELKQVISRTNDFRGDPQVETRHRVETSDYKGSHFDRGHMCPSADMRWSKQAQSECFYMTNICPQMPELNQKWWEHLESAERRWAKQEGAIYICCGPIYNNDKKMKTIGKDVKIRVPNAFFKVILSLRKNQEKAIGFIYANRNSRQAMEDVACSVDSVERVTGLNFYHNLPTPIEKKLEATYNLSLWN